MLLSEEEKLKFVEEVVFMNDIEKTVSDIKVRQASTDTDYSVVMANDMIRGCSALSLNELKLLRTIIMQIKPEDKELYPYKISVRELQTIMGISGKRIYDEAQKMCVHLLQEVILIGDGNPKHKWRAFQWVSLCEYNEGIFLIKLNDALKPYVIGLQRFYTQFKLEDIVRMNSVHAIRLLEMIYEALKGTPVYADQSAEVYIPVDALRKATNTENKYTSINRWTERIIKLPLEEINRKNGKYYISYRPHKESRKIVGFFFLIESATWHHLKESDPEKAEQLALERYMKKQKK